MKDFLKHYIESKQGDVLNEKGEVIAEPLKFDGYMYRSIDEDVKYDEFNKSKGGNMKKTGVKKK